MDPTPTAPAKLSVRDLWKIYGPDPGRIVAGRFAEMTPEERLAHVRASGHFVAAGNVSFDVAKGSIFVIMGLSGSGKSTVLRAISRLIEPSWGEVLLDGENLATVSAREMIAIRRHKMGMVFQNFGLLPHLTVLENVALPLRAKGMARPARRARAMQMIELVGLQGKEDAWPHELSGGQQQRVGIARSLAVEPELWLLDEPFSALDPLIRSQMQDEFLRLQRQLGKTIVFVTHDFLEALKLADRICIMKDGEIQQTGTPSQIVLHPTNDYVRRFVGDVPLAKVLRAGDVMGPPLVAPEGPARPQVRATDSLEAAIRLFDEQTASVDVVDATGKVIGSLDPHRIVRSLYQDAAAA